MDIPEFIDKYFIFILSSTLHSAFKVIKADCLAKFDASIKYTDRIREDLLIPLNKTYKEITGRLNELKINMDTIMSKYENTKEVLNKLVMNHKKLSKKLDDSLEVYNNSVDKSKSLI